MSVVGVIIMLLAAAMFVTLTFFVWRLHTIRDRVAGKVLELHGQVEDGLRMARLVGFFLIAAIVIGAVVAFAEDGAVSTMNMVFAIITVCIFAAYAVVWYVGYLDVWLKAKNIAAIP